MERKISKVILSLMFSGILMNSCSTHKGNIADLPMSPYAKMREVTWSDVKWTEGFWANKFELCRKEIAPAVYEGLSLDDNNCQLHNLAVAAGLKEGVFQGNNWSDGDCYKWIESLAFLYAVNKDPKLDSTMDYWIDAIGKAQRADGYISTNMTLQNRVPYMESPNVNWYSGTFHEMYNQGHLLSAACTHYKATGKTTFLVIAQKLADYMTKVFKPGVPELRAMNGNQPQIMGLIDMYRVTGNKSYLETAQLAVDIRATLKYRSDRTQDHVPFREETEAVGHGVFATYLYSGAADLFAETGEKSLWDALNRIWENAAYKRTYITGAVGSGRNMKSTRGDEIHEGFGPDYELPNRTAYNETCANIGNAMWNWRMALLTGDAKYTDILETALYNSVLSGVSLDGKTFFYPNPLTWYKDNEGKTGPHPGERKLKVGFCCPTNLVRTIAAVGKWVYSVSNDTVWVHLFGSNTLKTTLPNGKKLVINQESQYPWDGNIKISFGEVQKKATTVMIRVPGWAENSSLKVNQKNFKGKLNPGSYLAIKQKWSAGDVIELNLPMPVRLIEANPQVEDCRNSVAIMRGPLVYCAEFPIAENGEQIWNNGVFLNENVVLTPKMEKEMLGGVVVLKGKAVTNQDLEKYPKNSQEKLSITVSPEWDEVLYRKFTPGGKEIAAQGSLDVTLIPYYAWANRGPAYMAVWIPLVR